MTGSNTAGRMQDPAEAGMERTAARRAGPWEEIPGLLALAAALGLWLVVLAGVVAPLGDALARLDAHRPAAPAPCPAHPDALASAPATATRSAGEAGGR